MIYYIFEIKKEHIKLIRKMSVMWNSCEFGAPSIDPKRPYGNSDVISDIAEILGIEDVKSHKKEIERLHRETQIALQIILKTGKFKTGFFEFSEINLIVMFGNDMKEYLQKQAE